MKKIYLTPLMKLFQAKLEQGFLVYSSGQGEGDAPAMSQDDSMFSEWDQ